MQTVVVHICADKVTLFIRDCQNKRTKTVNILNLISTFARNRIHCIANNMSGLYVHIPFCASRCIYCGFYSTTLAALRARYVDALGREMRLRAAASGAETISTVYIGGGTPSQLTADELHSLFLYINNVYSPDWDNIEVTMECNPDDVTAEFCQVLKGLPVNRVSMGAQTFSDERLRFLHRRHTAVEVRQAVSNLHAIGIGNISVDLMFAFPGETLRDWQSDIDAALSLDVEHISAYSLQYEEGTTLYNMLRQGKIREIDDELYRQMYNTLCDRLTAAGYEHYEISNFAKPGHRSRHNSSYWHNVPYIGIGASAHSYSCSARSWNVSDIRQYITSVEASQLPSEQEVIDDDTHYDDTVMTALRTCEGIDVAALKPCYQRYILSAARPYIDGGDIEFSARRLRLTRNGIFVSDMIMADLMMG